MKTTLDTPVSANTSADLRTALLGSLRCSYCGSALKAEKPGNLEYAVLRCDCHDYPIVAGIPVLQQMDGVDRVVKLIRQGQNHDALMRTLDLFRVQWALKSRIHRWQYQRQCQRLVNSPDAPLAEAAQHLRRPKVFADYLTHRYANPSFLASVGPILLLGDLAGASGAPTVLDLGCGAGHATFLMRLLFPELAVVSADQDFVNLYLTRRYMAPDGLQLCIDGQVPLPLPDHTFNAVYCQDAFHYMAAKKPAVAELKRVAHPGALWLFPHLHNRLCPNMVAGIPMSPSGYLACFDLPEGRMFAESDLLRGLVDDRTVDFETVPSADALDRAPNLTFIRGLKSSWRKVTDFPAALARRPERLTINPIYQRTSASDGVRLRLTWPNPVIQKECAEAETVLPTEIRIPADQWARIERHQITAGESWSDDLIARFVLVALPPNYSAADKH